MCFREEPGEGGFEGRRCPSHQTGSQEKASGCWSGSPSTLPELPDWPKLRQERASLERKVDSTLLPWFYVEERGGGGGCASKFREIFLTASCLLCNLRQVSKHL